MSTTAPWNIQTTTKDSGNVKLFNPLDTNTALQNGPTPQTDGSQQANWNSGWGTDNQYGQYNNIPNSDGQHMQQSGEGYNQNDFQNQQYTESQQFYNLNPGIQTQQYDGQIAPQYDQQGQPVQQWATNNQSVQQFDPQGQYTQQFDSQGQTFQQYDAQGQPIQSYNNQYNQQYNWNNDWSNYGYQQTYTEQPTSAASEVPLDQSINSDTQSNSGIQLEHSGNTSDIINDLGDSTKSFGSEASVKNENIGLGNNNENNLPYSGSFQPEGAVRLLEPENNSVPQTYHPEISGESLVTLNSSSTQMAEDNSLLSIENQMNSLVVQDKIDTDKGDVNHSAIDGQGQSSETNPTKTSKDSPVNSQTSDDWEMIPSAQNLLAPNSHSRQGSMDSSSNVHFFIGSTNISPSNTPASNEDANQPEKKKEEVSPQSSMIPKHSSSPMPPKSDIPKSSVDGPQSSSSIGHVPPMAMPPSGSKSVTNPFRKGNPPGHHGGKKFEEDSASKNDGLKLDIAAAESGFPSPIPVASEDSQNLPTQSPIMPRKESPFQPPRRRNLSQSSNSFDDENVALHSEERHVSGSKSEHIPKENNMDVKLGGTDRRGPMKADRSIGSMVQSAPDRHRDAKNDFNKYSYRGKDDRRPPSPLSSSSSRNITGRTTPTKPPTGRTTPTKPSGRTTPGRITPSRRIEREAYQKVVERRRKETVSPATSLWATNDVVPKTNILLAPAAPLQTTTPVLGLMGSKHGAETREVLSPVENLITSMSDHLSRENSPEKDVPKSKSASNDISRRDNTQKDRHERNSSIDREIEMTKRMEDKERLQDNSRDRSYRDYKDDRNYKGSVRDDRNPAYRDERYRDRERERDFDRDRHYEAYYERQRNNRSRDPYYDERYERPRSRQSTVDGQEQSTDRSRNDRDAYYRDRYGQRGYYDYYGRPYGYYDQRYADYYGDSRYSKAYYDEYYGGQYQENYDRMSRYDYTWQNAGYYDQYRHDDTYSQRSDSRVHTPGSLSDSGDQMDGYNRGSRTSSRQGYPEDYQRGHYDPYYYGYQDYYGNSYMEPEPPGRMTPEKYTLPHLCARFGPGGHLIKVMPNRPKEGQTATVEIHDINTMLEDRPEVEELKCFPGPLVRGDTHKNDVLSFCQQRSKACSENITMTDRDSAELIWKLLELLIKQNGMIVGTDIADLLLEGHEPTTVEYSLMGMKISNSMDNLDLDMDDTNEISNVTMDRSVVNRGQRSREEVTDRFRHLLLYGRKKDALEWAMKNNLWGHALFLASKMDPKAHANVMTRFANSAMKMNDPLQTLYQLMSGRQPAAVSCITDEKWGDWRPHLAMMLSNQTHKTDQDRKYIMTMGDTLASKGFLHASHFCYLIAQVGFGSYHKKTSKMVLIGSNHSLPLAEFATNEAIQCSEVYEYAMSLANPAFFSPNLQYFKFLYACRMAENGFAQQALEYCEVIAKCINISPTVFQPTLVKLVYELASRLKKFDPEKQHVGEDSDDPMWLQHLQRINQGFEDGSIQPLSGSATPYYFVGTRSSSASGEVAGLTDMGGIQSGSLTGGSPYPQGQQQQMYTQGYTPELNHNQMYTNDQNQYHHVYTNNQTQNQAVTDSIHEQNQVVDQGYNTDQSQLQDQGHQSSQNQTVDQNQLYSNQNQGYSQQSQGYSQQSQDYSQQSQGYSQQGQSNTDQEQNYVGQGQTYQPQQTDLQQNQQYYTQDGQTGYQYQHHDLQTVPEVTNQNQGYNAENKTGETPAQNYPSHDFSMYHHTGVHPGQRHNSISSASTMSSHGDVEDDESSMNQSHTKSDFDYFGAATTQKIVAPRLRKRTESESSQVNAPKSSESKPTEIKPDDKKDDKKNQSQSKGWFGGVFSKLMPKSKNEMKLPDDKNPAIVWDPVKKRWTNQDGDDDDDKPTAPPPKDMDLSSGSTPGNLTPASTSTSTPAMGPPAGNRYGRPRGRGARTQYVDVMNPKSTGGSASVPSNLFNVMPTSASSPAIFNPSHGKDSTDSSQPETNSAQPNMPPSDQRIDSGERDTTEMPPPSSGPPSMPMLFNPSQVTQSSSNPATQSGLKKYNQRRVYPKS